MGKTKEIETDEFEKHGKKNIEFFDRINKNTKERNMEIEHYIISFDTKEMINATIILESILKNLYIII